MAPKRTSRRTAETPSPAQKPSPARGAAAAGRAAARDVSRASNARTPMPAKYSTSYGSPMAQLPDRAVIHGGGSLSKAASDLFVAVKKDKKVAAERRKAEAVKRASGTSTRGSSRAPSDGTREKDAPYRDDGQREESEDEEELVRREEAARLQREKEQREREQATTRKRARDDTEAEKQAEKERLERDERLRRGREAAAKRKAEAREAAEREQAEQERLAQEAAAREQGERERLAQEAAAREQAEQERRAQVQPTSSEQAERERLAQEAAKLKELRQRRHRSQPPPPTPEVTQPRHVPVGRGVSVPPIGTPIGTGTRDFGAVPPSVRSFIEEGDLYEEARLRTPKPSSPVDQRQPGIAKPPGGRPGVPLFPKENEFRSRPEVPSGPSPPVVRRPLGSSTQESPTQPRHDDQTQTGNAKAGAQASQHRPARENLRKSAQPRVHELDENAPLWAKLKHFLLKHQPSFGFWDILKALLTAVLLLYTFRFLYGLAHPELHTGPGTSLHWYGFSDWKNNVGQFGQFLPPALLHPRGVLSDDQYDDLKVFLEKQAASTESAVKSIADILPRMVHVKKDRNKGKLVINDEFWRALRDQIHADDSIFTLQDGKLDISDRHWKVIRDRFKKSGDLQDITERTMSKSWDTWFRNNERRVADIVGQNLPIKKLAGQMQDVVITREQFVRELEDSLGKRNKDIDDRLNTFRSSLESWVKDATKHAPSSPQSSPSEPGMSQAEINTLVHKIVDKAIKNAKLEAAASNQIARFDSELRHHVNHFAIGNGAIVDVTLSSPTWQIAKPAFGSPAWLNALPKVPRFQAAAAAALAPWEEAGHCWCAGTRVNATTSRPADLAVRLANYVAPQHVVVEHIDPAATLDGDAMPKGIEVWARFDEYGLRERVRDWSTLQFPDSEKRNPELVGKGFVQVGGFEYRYSKKDGGVHVEKLSAELAGSLKAATDHLVVRATSNHGNGDHTCFYRVRLYGEVVMGAAGENVKHQEGPWVTMDKGGKDKEKGWW